MKILRSKSILINKLKEINEINKNKINNQNSTSINTNTDVIEKSSDSDELVSESEISEVSSDDIRFSPLNNEKKKDDNNDPDEDPNEEDDDEELKK